MLNSWPFPVSWVLLSARPVKQNQNSPAVYLLRLFCTSRSAMNWDRSWARPLPRTETSHRPQAYTTPDQLCSPAPSADKLLDFLPDFEISVGVEIVINNVAIFQDDFQAQRIVAIDGIVPQEFDAVAFFFVVNQRAVEIGIDQKIAHVVFAHKLGVFTAAERPDLPTQRAVISLHLGHALQSKGLTHQVGAHVLLPHEAGESASGIQLACHANRFNGFDFVHPALGLDILGYQFVGTLGKSEAAEK